MTLSRDDITEASLLKDTKEEHGASPTLEEEVILLGKKPEATSLPEHQRDLNHQSPQNELMLSPLDPLSKLTLLVPLLFPPLHPTLAATLPERQWNPRETFGMAQSKQVTGSTPTYRWWKLARMVEGVQISSLNEGQVLWQHQSQRAGHSGKLQPSGCQLHSRKKITGGPLCPGWVCWSKGTISPQEFQGIWDYWEVWHEEMVALAMALQMCTIHSRTPPGMLCRAIQELHSCLTSYLRVEIY